ncbi:MAG: MTH938/NDUFAF3 family protein [Methanocellales archaeon]
MIDSYEFGRIVVNGKQYDSDLIIFPDFIKENWWRKSGHSVDIEDLEEAIAANPEVIIIGTGYYGRVKISREAKNYLKSRGIQLIAENTSKATVTYNRLLGVKKAVAALHLTC